MLQMFGVICSLGLSTRTADFTSPAHTLIMTSVRQAGATHLDCIATESARSFRKPTLQAAQVVRLAQCL